MTNVSCPWNLFDDREKEALDDALDLTGTISCILSLWFILAYFFSTLKENWSYYNIGFFLISAWIRRSISITVNYALIDKKSALWQDVPLRETFAFVETFMAVHEVECLTHICIERFVVAKYICNGWPMPKKHYVMFRWLCVLFASAYSLALVLGFGRFGFDFSCTTSTMDMILSEGWRKYIVIAIFLLRSIKPAGFMLFMLVGCKAYESSYNDSENHQLQRQITRDAIVVTCVSLVCWAPIALIRGWVVLTQLVYGPGGFVLPPAVYVKWALLIHWNSLTPSVFILFLLDRNIRNATLQLRLRNILGKTKNKDQ